MVILRRVWEREMGSVSEYLINVHISGSSAEETAGHGWEPC
jgi:hypothetical protein